jgi:nucleoside 2-deoxyribosyltransferase
MMNNVSIYFASPLGFAESTVEFMEKLEMSMAEQGFHVINPWKVGGREFGEEFRRLGELTDSSARIEGLKKLNMNIGKRNEELINDSDVVVAVLDGVDVDSGTASEIGYAYAEGKKIIGYRGDFRLTGDNEGTIVNLQVQYWIEKSGGKIVNSIDNLKAALEDILKENTN